MELLGVTEKENKIINEILEEYKNGYSFYYYGSRVKGNFNKTSDLDILIKGENEMSFSDLIQLKEKTDKSNLPYIVNFTDYKNIDEHFYNLIKNDLVKISK